VTYDAITKTNHVSMTLMILKKQNSQSARWDKENNKWILGTTEYQWNDMKNKSVSPWLNFDNSLVWIQEYDRNKTKILE
jgi:hypothetical protein